MQVKQAWKWNNVKTKNKEEITKQEKTEQKKFPKLYILCFMYILYCTKMLLSTLQCECDRSSVTSLALLEFMLQWPLK